MAGRPPKKPDQDSPEALYGARLRAARERAKKRAEDVTEALGIANETLWAWERGDRFPNPFYLRKLTKIYRCSGNSLLPE